MNYYVMVDNYERSVEKEEKKQLMLKLNHGTVSDGMQQERHDSRVAQLNWNMDCRN
jgi:hypothetical protein